MDTATPHAVPKTYIAEWIKLDFYNNSNLKTDIQNRVSVNIKTIFLDALNDMKGNNKNNYGTSFSEITKLALAYFYSEIFTHKIKDSYYTVEMVKGFLDANNLTNYTAIYEIDVPFYKLNDAPLFKHCWLIIQSAWFFNSEHFGQHQHVDYLNHYISTGKKLPIENYKYDPIYLNEKYKDIDKAEIKYKPQNGYIFVSLWYYSILFLICKELQLSTTHFNISLKGDRETNPLPLTSRQLRPLTPFKIIECDIKSAFPTFLDIITGANLKDHIYNNLMQSKGINRGEAKTLFNRICNSGAYNSEQYTKSFFLECGYTEKQCDHLITLTHNPEKKFYYFMTDYESNAINFFIVSNNLQRGARLHDALYFIDDKTRPAILKIKPNVDFGYKELNRPVIKESFSISNKFLPYEFIGSIPKGLNLITKTEPLKGKVIGQANGFKFYEQKFQYFDATFNLNDYNLVQSENSYQIFFKQCEKMLSTIKVLNKRNIKPLELELILKHIRQHGKYVFNVRALYLRLMKCNANVMIESKSRDFDLTENLKFKRRGEFAKARNGAIKQININNNYKDLIDLLHERIYNNDYEFLYECNIKGKRPNNLLVYGIKHVFNKLCNHRKNKPIFDTLFINTNIKSVLKTGLSEIDLKKQRAKENRLKLKQKKISELIEMNKHKIEQLYLILCKVAGEKKELDIKENNEIQNELKHELIQYVTKLKINNIDAGVNCFDCLYKPISTNEIEINTNLKNSFDADLSNSIFNQLNIEQAKSKDPIFLKEYLKFHKKSKQEQINIINQIKKEQFEFSIIKFDD